MELKPSCAKLARSVIGDMKLLADSLEASATRRDNAVSILRECEERVLDALGLSHCGICGAVLARAVLARAVLALTRAPIVRNSCTGTMRAH